MRIPGKDMEEGDKQAWGQVGSASRGPRDIARGKVEEKEGDKQGAVAGLLNGSSRTRNSNREAVPVEEGDKQGAVAGLLNGSTRPRGNGNRNLRGSN